MKRTFVLGLLAMVGFFFGASFANSSNAAESNGEITKVKVEISEGTQKTSGTVCEMADGKSELKSNCCWCSCYYYYTPYVYYYVPCYYTYRCVWYYNGTDKSKGAQGLKIDETPKADTALAKLGVKKGDVILKINGKAIKSADDIKKIDENSDLTVLKGNAGSDSIDEFIRN